VCVQGALDARGDLAVTGRARLRHVRWYVGLPRGLVRGPRGSEGRTGFAARGVLVFRPRDAGKNAAMITDNATR
jgi:hypothetical protein